MDLIKNYGSYENAKAELEKIKSTKYRNYMYLEDALLEYRRANNIFEVGDKIVYLDEPILRSITDVKTVKLVKSKSLWAYYGVKHDQSTEVYFHQIRHATPEEIAAGRRL